MDGDVILGVRARETHAPATLDDCVAVMARAARDRLRLGFVGGGTAIGLGTAPSGLDAIVRTTRLARIVEHAPADQVVIAEAGVTLAQLQAALAGHGQRIALDAPDPERATIGGLVATAGFGPLRARYGAIRDLIIGVTLIRADGEVARGGGKVVKNVAGFDLPKVACGSLGTLGLIATATFRLHPLPESVHTVRVAGVRPDQVVAVIAAARAAQLEPTAAVALAFGADPSYLDRFDLAVRFEGFGHGVAQQVSRFVEIAATAGAPAEPLAADDADALWRLHDAVRASGPLRFRVAALPTQFPAVAAGLVQLAGLGMVAWYATLGVGFAGGALGDVGATAAALTAARTRLVAGGGSLVIEDAPPELRALIDPWGPPPPSFPIMQRLKQRFDPDGRCNPGRFVGGL